MSEPTPPMYGGSHPMSPTNERTWMAAAHWSALVAAFVALAFLGPLIIMLTKGNESPRVRQQAVEALNFNLSILIYGIISVVLVLVLIGIFMLIAVGVLWLVCTIVGAVKASSGEPYRYPLTIRMIN